jgi:photosystem II stability/assembly factor-like uncharacterized protein
MKYLNYLNTKIKPTKTLNNVINSLIYIIFIFCSTLLYAEKLNTFAGLSGDWENIGPENIAGKVRTCTISTSNPNVMWLGSDGSGIWNTDDGGATWINNDSFPSNITVTSILIDPINSNIMYASTGNGLDDLTKLRGQGIFKSVDSGTTWSQINTTNNADWYFINRLTINSDGTVILAGLNSGIYRSTDQGETWSLVLANAIYDIEFDVNSTTDAIASGTEGHTWYSTDGGQTWLTGNGIPNTSGKIELAYSPTENLVWASVNINKGAIYKSIDGGINYELFDTTEHLKDTGETSNVIWCVPNDSNIIYFGGVDLYKLEISSNTLTQISQWQSAPLSPHSGHHAIVPHPEFGTATVNNNIIFDCNDGGIYKGDLTQVNGDSLGTGWTALNNKLVTTQIISIAGNSETSVLIAGTLHNGTLSYQGNSNNWTPIMSEIGGICAFDTSDSNICYGSGKNLKLFRNIHGAESPSDPANDYINGIYFNDGEWTWKDSPYYIPDSKNETCEDFAPFIIDQNISDQSTLLAGGLELWKTEDAKTINTPSDGPSWVSIKPSNESNISAISIAPGNSDVILVGHVNGDLYKTINGTNAIPVWEKLDDNQTSLPNRKILNIFINSNDNDIIFICFNGFETDNVYSSSDGGSTWHLSNGTDANTLPPIPVYTLTAHPKKQDWLYAGTPNGLYASEDNGTSWFHTDGITSKINIKSFLWLSDANDISVLNIGTNGYGIFRKNIEYIPLSPEIDIKGVTINEGNADQTPNAIIEVCLSKAQSFPICVNFTTNDGSALISDNDYLSTSGILTFNENETQYITVPINGDDTVEPNEEFTVNLTDQTDGVILLNDNATIIIADDDNPDLPELSMTASETQISEDSGQATITLALSKTSSTDVQINLQYSGSAEINKDYSSVNSVIIPAGDLSTNITVTTIQDDIYEYDETITATVISVLNAKTIDMESINIIIEDDDNAPNITINDISVNEGNLNTDQGTFTVTLSAATEKNITVDYATTDGTAIADEDYIPTNGHLDFPPGTIEQDITVEIIGDELDEGDEEFTVNLSNATENTNITKSEGICSIIDNDMKPPEVTINNIIVSEGNNPDISYAKFEITLSGAKDFPVDLNYSTENGTAENSNDYLAASGTFSFVSNGTAFLNIRIFGDDDIEDNENFFVNITGPDGVIISQPKGECIIADDDDPNLPIITLSVSSLELNEGLDDTQITANLSVAYTKDVLINLNIEGNAKDDGVDYTISNKAIVIPQGQMQGNVTLVATHDDIDEFDETINLSIASVLNGLLPSEPQEYIITILDANDPPEISINNISFEEGDIGALAKNFTISLSSVSGKTITVDYATKDGSATVADNDYFAKHGSLTFEPGEISKDLQIFIISDEKFEDNEEFYVDISNSSDNTPIAIQQGSCTILNDDSAEPSSISISDVTVNEGNLPDTVNATFTVTLANTKHFPVTVSYMTINNTAHSEDDDYEAIEGTLTFNDNTSQDIVVTVLGDDLYENDETFFLNLYNVSPGVEFAKHLGICTILDDDIEPPSISIEDIHIAETNTGETANAVFTITLSSAYIAPITVDYETVDGTAFSPDDYTAASGTITIDPGQSEANVTIIVNGDFDDESDEVFILKLLNPKNATINDSMGVCFIEDDDISYKLWVNKGSGSGEYVSGETVTITADPPEKGDEFKEWIDNSGILEDKTSETTTLIMPDKDVSFTATYESAEKVSLGSVIKLAAVDIPDMNMTNFTKKPKVYGTFYDIIKDKTIKLNTQVITKVNASMPAEEVKAIWKKTVALYDKTLWKDAKKAGILTAAWLEMNPWQNSSEDCNVYAKVATPGGEKVDLFVKSVLLSVPKITSVKTTSGSDITNGVSAGSTLILKGHYFGTKAPRIYFEYISGGVVKQQKIKVLKPLVFSDGKGILGKSCMDVESVTGDSEIKIQLPTTWWKGWTNGEYSIVLDNKIGLSTFPVLTK